MKRSIAAVAIVASLVAYGCATRSPSTPIVLPVEADALRPSPLPGHAIASQKCTICHSTDYIDYQPPGMTFAQWTAEMKKMKALYGAPLGDDEIEPLAAYLASAYGDASTVPAAMAGPAKN